MKMLASILTTVISLSITAYIISMTGERWPLALGLCGVSLVLNAAFNVALRSGK